MPPTSAPTKYSAAATCSSRAKLVSVSMPLAISPTQATALRADVLPTAFCMAAATPLRSGATDVRFAAASGVMVSARPMATTAVPGSR